MDRKEALNILIAYVCCMSSHISCEKCPFDNTRSCANVIFDDVLEDAINIMLEGETNHEKNEIK